MYSYLTGKVVEIDFVKGCCVLDVNNIGYEIFVAKSVLDRMVLGEVVKLFIEECSGGLYTAGSAVLYGFLSKEEREIFLAFKENLSNVGPKKALEYLDKVSKNPSEFWVAVQSKNYKVLTSLFGFRQSSAEKIIMSLSSVSKNVKITTLDGKISSDKYIDRYTDIVSAMANLGYKESYVKDVIEKVLSENSNITDISALITLVLKEISLASTRK